MLVGAVLLLAGCYAPPSDGSMPCPVTGTVRFVDDFGAPRSGGRTHQGVDIFASRGRPNVAVVGLADPDHVHRVLDAAGFEGTNLGSIDEPVELGRDADDAFSFVRTLGIVEGLTRDLDDESKARALDEVHAALVVHETDEGVLLGSSAWLITARAAG